MKISIPPEIYKKDKFYGSTLMGARGQVVIPADARRDLGLKPGDRLLVVGKAGQAVCLMNSDDLDEVISSLVSTVSGAESRKEFQQHVSKLFGSEMRPKGGGAAAHKQVIKK